MSDIYFFDDFSKKLRGFIESCVSEKISNHTRKMDRLIEELETSKYATFGIANKMTELTDEFSMLGAEVQRTFEAWEGSQINQSEWRDKVEEALRQLSMLQVGHNAVVKDYFTLQTDVEDAQVRLAQALEEMKREIGDLRVEVRTALNEKARMIDALEQSRNLAQQNVIELTHRLDALSAKVIQMEQEK